MPNPQNVKPYEFKKGHFTSEEAAKIGKKGGIASGKAKREKKAAREIVKSFFEENVKTSEGHNITRKQLMLLNALKRINNSIMLSNKKNTALTNEELKCLDYALSMIGEAPIPKTQQEVSINAPIEIVDDIDTKPEGTD